MMSLHSALMKMYRILIGVLATACIQLSAVNLESSQVKSITQVHPV